MNMSWLLVKVGSPTALADEEIEKRLLEEAHHREGHGLYIPAGAFWGGQDVQKMADRGTLKVSINWTLFERELLECVCYYRD